VIQQNYVSLELGPISKNLEEDSSCSTFKYLPSLSILHEINPGYGNAEDTVDNEESSTY
jgi:hypothetical protein